MNPGVIYIKERLKSNRSHTHTNFCILPSPPPTTTTTTTSLATPP
ncbi:hypothetical protein PP707_04980 [Acetobacter pasteurianus]|nr:hypothetical protein [Acetobacter pasteurianus]